MSERKINPVLKQVLELGPTVAFFLIFMRIKGEVYMWNGTEYSGFIVAAVVFVPILLVAMGILWALTGKLSRMQMFTAFMVIFFGGLTAYFNNEAFFKMKTTIVWGLLAIVLGIGLARGTSYLEYIMAEFLPMEHQGWMILTRRMTALFAVMAVANEIVWRTQSDATWVTIETFLFPAIMAVFMVAQIFALQRFLIEEPDSKS